MNFSLWNCECFEKNNIILKLNCSYYLICTIMIISSALHWLLNCILIESGKRTLWNFLKKNRNLLNFSILIWLLMLQFTLRVIKKYRQPHKMDYMLFASFIKRIFSQKSSIISSINNRCNIKLVFKIWFLVEQLVICNIWWCPIGVPMGPI